MNRSVVAFLVAPLWVPLLVAPYCYLFVFPCPEQGHWVAIASILSAIFSYGGALLFGVPAFFILRSRGLSDIWTAGVVGFSIGALMWLVFGILLVLSLGEGTPGVRLAVTDMDMLRGAVFPAECLA